MVLAQCGALLRGSQGEEKREGKRGGYSREEKIKLSGDDSVPYQECAPNLELVT